MVSFQLWPELTLARRSFQDQRHSSRDFEVLPSCPVSCPPWPRRACRYHGRKLGAICRLRAGPKTFRNSWTSAQV